VASVFTRIITGELPGRFVWRDERCVAFLSINPLAKGHVLVVPIHEVDHWLDLDTELWTHVAEVSRQVGLAVQDAFEPPRVAQMIAGFEVPHVHVHVLPAADLDAMSFANAELAPDPAQLDDAAQRIRDALRALGHDEHVAD